MTDSLLNVRKSYFKIKWTKISQTDNSIPVTREKEEMREGRQGSKGVKNMVAEGDLTLGGEHTMLYTDDVVMKHIQYY